ncbi:hypothetical protein [Burkholderia stabilis]|uniref:hypothetical protein n=1 Tax=Burkholderia stabilis TaxID=95485 RepID=UPI00101291DE|nr:hypothetical protein [Burkholderia stabilis]
MTYRNGRRTRVTVTVLRMQKEAVLAWIDSDQRHSARDDLPERKQPDQRTLNRAASVTLTISSKPAGIRRRAFAFDCCRDA